MSEFLVNRISPQTRGLKRPVSTRAASPPTARRRAWCGRISDAVKAQLRAGMTPRKVALCIALGVVISVFPVVGLPTVLCTLLAVLLRLNLPLVQLANWSTGPLQYLLMIPFMRFGALFYGAAPLPLSAGEIAERVREQGLFFFVDSWRLPVHAVTGWLMVGPLVAVILYFVLHAVLHRLHPQAAEQR